MKRFCQGFSGRIQWRDSAEGFSGGIQERNSVEGFSGGIQQRNLIKSDEYSRGIQLRDSRNSESNQRDSAEESRRGIQWRNSAEGFNQIDLNFV